ncbi:MAG: hypothetical protein MUE85_00010 [Microscillaceae bacterium]|jgi:hypothetical protein|nr:hypothetical protein [Microscillaceae bacterium]
MSLEKLRRKYHQQIFEQLLFIDQDGVPSNADKHSQLSVALAKGIADNIAIEATSDKTSGQTSGKSFEKLTADFINQSFALLNHLRSGDYELFIGKSIVEFEQYEHLATLTEALKTNRELKATLGEYLINPDIVIGRKPIADTIINQFQLIIEDEAIAKLSPLRYTNSKKLILHASISCKWTIRSDRSQNARTEGLDS